MATNGLVVMTPTSIASTGSGNSSSINADGSVTFSSCATLSLNGVFTSSYDNYMIVIRNVASLNGQSLLGRLRASGVDASASNYTRQLIEANGTSVTANRFSDTAFGVAGADGSGTLRAGATFYLFGPFMTQPTAARSVSVRSISSAYITDDAGTHFLSLAYDGMTFIPFGTGNNISGLLTVFGFAQ